MLRPCDTLTRERKSLIGLWRFRLDSTWVATRRGVFIIMFCHPLTETRLRDMVVEIAALAVEA